ncbi:hypothetical protein A7982_12279 [Minicystis rosea]|nr:hypothetical protein A7982_12279 [Minicystis rosea]
MRERPRLPHEPTLLSGVSLEYRSDLVALGSELNRELLGLLKPV